jgi:hypothetical protein
MVCAECGFILYGAAPVTFVEGQARKKGNLLYSAIPAGGY